MKLNLIVPGNVGEKVREKVAARYNAIKKLIRENPFITDVQHSGKPCAHRLIFGDGVVAHTGTKTDFGVVH